MAVRAPDFRPDLDWINTGGRVLTLADFRGRILLLDFWTYGCINCIHMIPELAEVERRFPEEVVVVGVHSGKFINERVNENIARACERLGVHHPVLNDRQFRTWREYAVNAWPTLVVVSPDEVADTYNHRVKRLDPATREVRGFAGIGRAGMRDGASSEASFREPGGITISPDGRRAYVADTNNHRLRMIDLSTARVTTVAVGE